MNDFDAYPLEDPAPSTVVRGPCGKVRYGSVRTAQRAIRAIQRNKCEQRDRGKLHPYLCKVCRVYHVGHHSFLES